MNVHLIFDEASFFYYAWKFTLLTLEFFEYFQKK